ncbi:MAP10 protein, partial [Centropus unirufus]|nr:MAP10 protein [Centropus unirufus]
AEGLFSLELLVEAVRLAAPPGPALRPAVALRLLDFPTLLLLPPAAPPPRPGQPLPFGRGKRCLFRWPRGSLLSYRLGSLEGGGQRSPPGPAVRTPPAASPEPGRDEEEEKEEEEEEEEDSNIICPPVLYYSREPAEPRVPPAAVPGGKWEHVESWRPQEPDKGQIPPRPGAGPSLLHPSSCQQLSNVLGQLPLLSALLAELSVLTRSAAGHPQVSGATASQPPSPRRSSALKPAETPAGAGGSSGAASRQVKQGRRETTSSRSQAGRGPKKAVPQGEAGSGRHCTTKENRPPGRKLLYGLTNTLRLRLQQNNPDKLIIHERREQYRKKQMGTLKERSPISLRKPLRNDGEQDVVSCRHCSKGGSSKQKSQFDKHVETSLQNSVLPECVSMAGHVSSDQQKQSIESLLKNDGIISKESLLKVTTAPLVDEKSSEKEKDVKAQLPAAFPTDANAKGNTEEVRDLIHHKTTEHDDVSVSNDHKPSSSRSVENNSEFIYSDDFVASPENTDYSEDFTIDECAGRDLEALDSSPEPPWPESPKRGWSDTELDSCRSRISKTSHRVESTSDLLPVPSISSPVQTLKRIHDLKNSKQSSGESVDSITDASIQPKLLDEEQEAQQISKENNGGDQHLKQLSMLRSKEANSGTDVNIGKGQTSAGKSQSITQARSHLSSNMSDIEFNVVENRMSEEQDDFLGKLCLPSQYKDISELVICKLPGYTM